MNSHEPVLLQIFNLIHRMRSMYRELVLLKREIRVGEHSAVDSVSVVEQRQRLLEEQFGLLRQNLNDIIQGIGDDILLDGVPATPPLEDIQVSLVGSKRRGTQECRDGRTKRTRQSAHDAHLPKCLQDLCNPFIGDVYSSIKVGAYMTANILVLNIQRLQPRAQMVPLISQGTVILLHEAVSLNISLLSKATSAKGGLATLVCASFWVLAKFGGIRGVTPDASLVSLAAGIKAADLKQMEIDVMTALGWDIIRPLKNHPGLDIQSLIM